jgi:hypothetical protein
VRARLTIEKEALLLRAANENYSQQVEALTAQVADLEEAIQEATAHSTLATQQLQEVSDRRYNTNTLAAKRVWFACLFVCLFVSSRAAVRYVCWIGIS